MMAKSIGIVGVSAEGAALCYKTICSEASNILGPCNHPEIFLHNYSFHTILEAQNRGNWSKVTKIVLNSITKLASIGADFAIIPANSVHYAFDLIKKNSPIPLLSIVEIVAKECTIRKFKKVAILGVGITMKNGLYNEPLKKFCIISIVPNSQDQKTISDIIYNEIISNNLKRDSIKKIIKIIKKFKKQKCDGVILACTELPIVITEANSPLPFIDTTRLLAKKAVEFAIK